MRAKNHNSTLGRRGEDIAAALLCEKGMTVLRRNWRAGHKEVDIICTDGRDIRFVEVKTRKKPVEGEPWEAVNGSKQHNLLKAAQYFLNGPVCRKLPFEVEESHFDIVSIVFEADSATFVADYIPDAFVPVSI